MPTFQTAKIAVRLSCSFPPPDSWRKPARASIFSSYLSRTELLPRGGGETRALARRGASETCAAKREARFARRRGLCGYCFAPRPGAPPFALFLAPSHPPARQPRPRRWICPPAPLAAPPPRPHPPRLLPGHWWTRRPSCACASLPRPCWLAGGNEQTGARERPRLRRGKGKHAHRRGAGSGR